VIGLVVVMRLAVGMERIDNVVLQRWVLPFALGFEEQGEGVGADVYGVEYGLVDAYGV